MKFDNYLADYRKSCDVDLSRGLSGYLRKRLDNMAVKEKQPNRHALFLPRVYSLFGLSLEKQLTVMEIGCGNGWAISYRNPKIKYIALDRGSVFRTDLESRGIEFHEADVETTPLPVANQSVDLILLNHVIEHIANSDYFVGELHRVLRSNGCLYIRTPNLEKVGWSFWNDYTHVKPFTESSLDHLMRTYGTAELIRNFACQRIEPRTFTQEIAITVFSGALHVQFRPFARLDSPFRRNLPIGLFAV